MYDEDLKPLLEQINIVFDLELSPTLLLQLEKYGRGTLIQKGSKQEFNEEIKKSSRKVLSNLSKTYISKFLDLYFSQEGLTLFIVKALIDLSKDFTENKRKM